MINKIDIGRDFSRSPSGRVHRDGPHNGTKFREDMLKPILLKHGKDDTFQLVIVLDNAEGYGSSFLEEAFGGLIRNKICTAERLLDILLFEYTNKEYKFFEDRIIDYIKGASKQASK